MIDLLTRRPDLHPDELTADLIPSPRFYAVRFDNYQPNPHFPSQAQARTRLEQFVGDMGQVSGGGGLLGLFRRKAVSGKGLYLDGGFGVGKTHLLASTYYASSGKRALMSFQDLMYVIGALGMEKAVAAFRQHQLLLIDEFELDDPGSTHMANTFLGQLMPAGTHVVATSNTEPGALGQGRFNARDFQRQIQGIADRFETLSVDGPDYRQRGTQPEDTLSAAEFEAWQARQQPDTLALIPLSDLNKHLLEVHPSRFARMLEGVGAVGVLNLAPLPDQNVALRFVHFVDKLYDLGLPAAFTGTPLTELFDDSYRHGAFAKKYSRCLSRLSEMLAEARA